MTVPADSPEILERFHSQLELVDVVARQLARSLGRIADFEDLVAHGKAGLLEAARRYDPTRGVPFRAFANFRVRGAMLDGVRSMARLPRRAHQRLRALEAASFTSEGAAEDAFVPPALGATSADADRALAEHLAAMATAMAVGLVSEAATGEEGEPTTVAAGASPEEAFARAELLEIVRGAVDELPEPEGELVRRHYLEGERLDRVASDLGLSKSWVSRIHTRAVGRLSKRLRAAGS